jgi:hypothetical protein
MAEALAKIKDGFTHPATTGDTDGSLLTALLEALTAGARLNVGSHGRTTHSPTNYTKGGDADDLVDRHLLGIDTALGVRASTTHKDTHKSGGGDALTSSDLLEAVVKRLQVTGPVTLTVGACADGKFLKRSGSTLIGDDPPGMSAHALGGAYHDADTLANLNSKVTGGNLDFDSASRPPSAHDLHSHDSCTLAQLNADISDATLDTSSASRPPSGSASGDLSSTYPGPTVSKIVGQTIQTGTPSANDILQYISSQWQHVAGLTPDYDSGWFTVHYSTANNVSKTHSLGVLPRHVEVYFSTDSGTTCHRAGYFWCYGSESTNRGIIVTEITTTTLKVRCGTHSSSGCLDTYGTGGTRLTAASGHARVICWK